MHETPSIRALQRAARESAQRSEAQDLAVMDSIMQRYGRRSREYHAALERFACRYHVAPMVQR